MRLLLFLALSSLASAALAEKGAQFQSCPDKYQLETQLLKFTSPSLAKTEYTINLTGTFTSTTNGKDVLVGTFVGPSPLGTGNDPPTYNFDHGSAEKCPSQGEVRHGKIELVCGLHGKYNKLTKVEAFPSDSCAYKAVLETPCACAPRKPTLAPTVTRERAGTSLESMPLDLVTSYKVRREFKGKVHDSTQVTMYNGKVKFADSFLPVGTYFYSIAGINAYGKVGEFSEKTKIVLDHLAVGGIHAYVLSNRIQISWAKLNDRTVTGYEVEQVRKVANNGHTVRVKATVTTHTTAPFVPGKYEFRVRGVWPGNMFGPWTKTGILNVLPTHLTGFKQIVNASNVTISWTGLKDKTVAWYEIDWSSNRFGPQFVERGVNNYTTMALTPQNYSFRVRAVWNEQIKGKFESAGAEVNITAVNLTNIKQTLNVDKIRFSWAKPNDTSITGYEIQWDGNIHGPQFVANNETAYQTPTLPPGRYALRGRPIWSDTLKGTFVGANQSIVIDAAKVSNVVSSLSNFNVIHLKWSGKVANSLTGYQVKWAGNPFGILDLGSDLTTFATQPLFPGKYTLHVRSVWAGSVLGPWTDSQVQTVSPARAVLNLTQTESESRITVSWTNSGSETVNGYEIDWDYNVFGVQQVDARALTYTTPQLRPNTYAMRVRAVWSDAVKGPWVNSGKKAKVIGITAIANLNSRITANRITVSWNDATANAVTGYEVDWEGNPDGPQSVYKGLGTYTTPQLMPGAYTIRVRAKCLQDKQGPFANATARTVPMNPLVVEQSVSGYQIYVTWHGFHDTTVTGYEIQWHGASGSGSTIVGRDVNQFATKDLARGKWTVLVRALWPQSVKGSFVTAGANAAVPENHVERIVLLSIGGTLLIVAFVMFLFRRRIKEVVFNREVVESEDEYIPLDEPEF
eukprot:14186_1